MSRSTKHHHCCRDHDRCNKNPCLFCPPGPQGFQGISGPQGAPGSSTGTQGPQGFQGVQGPQGSNLACFTSTCGPGCQGEVNVLVPITSVPARTDVVIQTLGQGAIMRTNPDGTVVGGNCRGAFATDWQASRTLSTEVASGFASAILGGENNTTSGDHAVVVGGNTNAASGPRSIIGGGINNAVDPQGVSSGVFAGATNGIHDPGNCSGSAIIAGNGNSINASGSNSNTTLSFIGAGSGNSINASVNSSSVNESFIGTGLFNHINASGSSSGANTSGIISGVNNVIVASGNTSSVIESFIGTGNTNTITASGDGSNARDTCIVAGILNKITASGDSSNANETGITTGNSNLIIASGLSSTTTNSFIGGGNTNEINATGSASSITNSFIGSGFSNNINASTARGIANNSFIGAGSSNNINGSVGANNAHSSFIGGGDGNTITNVATATIGGGSNNLIDTNATNGAIPGGLGLHLTTASSCAVGQYNDPTNFDYSNVNITGAVGAQGPQGTPTGTSPRIFMVGYGTQGNPMNLFSVTQDGNAHVSGTVVTFVFSDFGEYFESTDGNPIPVGTPVRFAENSLKITPTSQGEEAFGVISDTAGYVGNGAEEEWVGKYVRENGKVVLESGQRKLSPNFNSNQVYTPRSQRPEWNIVGLLGVVKVLKNAATGQRWIRIKEHDDQYDLYLIR